jgi:hypothetical protein
MSKCPFWSTTKSRVECYNTCPLFETSEDDSSCVFKENIGLSKINYKEIEEEEDFLFSDQKAFKLDFMDKPSTY